jgi:hypothetical protein
VRRLVIHSSAYRLSEPARALPLEVGRLAAERRWQAAWETLLRCTLQPEWIADPLAWFAALILPLDTPEDPSDLLITIAAEDPFNFQDRLAKITASTLVIAGERDPFYSVALFQATAEGIPNARLILYPGLGHSGAGKQFDRDVLAFLRKAKSMSTPIQASAYLPLHTNSIGRVTRGDRIGAWPVKDTLAHLTAWEQMIHRDYWDCAFTRSINTGGRYCSSPR